MRLILFFDLPSTETREVVEYRNFRRFLLKSGFVMMQESVYSKLVMTNSSLNLMKKQIERNLPSSGLIQMLQVTEKQYASIDYLLGKSKSNVIDNDKRIIEL